MGWIVGSMCMVRELLRIRVVFESQIWEALRCSHGYSSRNLRRWTNRNCFDASQLVDGDSGCGHHARCFCSSLCGVRRGESELHRQWHQLLQLRVPLPLLCVHGVSRNRQVHIFGRSLRLLSLRPDSVFDRSHHCLEEWTWLGWPLPQLDQQERRGNMATAPCHLSG